MLDDLGIQYNTKFERVSSSMSIVAKTFDHLVDGYQSTFNGKSTGPLRPDQEDSYADNFVRYKDSENALY